jgi:hypothetical protein
MCFAGLASVVGVAAAAGAGVAATGAGAAATGAAAGAATAGVAAGVTTPEALSLTESTAFLAISVALDASSAKALVLKAAVNKPANNAVNNLFMLFPSLRFKLAILLLPVLVIYAAKLTASLQATLKRKNIRLTSKFNNQ